MELVSYYSAPLLLLSLLQALCIANSQSFIGVNYGQVADNLPPPSATAKLLQSTSIQKVRLYGSDPAIIKALANTGIGITIGTSNGDIPSLASDPNFAKSWIDSNVIPFYPASKIILINVGNEVFASGDQNLMTNLLPAMQNVQNALEAASLGGKIKVSTVHSMAVLKQSEPPSAGSFDPSFGDLIKGLLGFNNATGSPFAINPYPYFAYRSDPRPETLAFCLFQPNEGRVDGNTKIKYMNMFDAQVDAVYSALSSMGFKNVEIVIAETGWPYKGDSDEVAPSYENAKGYNGNLIAHLRSMVGTPLMPGKSVDTYLFALYDEDLKPGPSSERSFGLFKPDLTMTYDIGLSKTTSQTPSSSPVQAPLTPSPTPNTATSPTPNTATWCLPKGGVSNAQLQQNLDYACGQGVDCSPVQPGGPCYEPNTVASHAAYAMNLLYQTSTRNQLDCDFSQTAIISFKNPSKFLKFIPILLHLYICYILSL
ncbi:glucan endo-1,3-beta-D-glucosidase-like isoform X1 [Euphorbia lathyris]|uniref:glucan endo-1,3-beta-D-glucosidase-like isoform X1 n=1 Tax=Euphorbia lathyris TaxID=212925 RepID=UPI003313B8A6